MRRVIGAGRVDVVQSILRRTGHPGARVLHRIDRIGFHIRRVGLVNVRRVVIRQDHAVPGPVREIHREPVTRPFYFRPAASGKPGRAARRRNRRAEFVPRTGETERGLRLHFIQGLPRTSRGGRSRAHQSRNRTRRAAHRAVCRWPLTELSAASWRKYQMRICSSSQPRRMPASLTGLPSSGRFREQIAALRLVRVHDFGEAVVVFRGLDEQLIEVSGRWQWIGIAGVRLEQDRETESARRASALVSSFEGGIRAAYCLTKVSISVLLRSRKSLPAARSMYSQPPCLKTAASTGNASRINHAQLAREQRLPHRVSEHFAPIDHIRARA